LARLLRSLAPQLVRGRHELFVAENGTPAPAQIESAGIALTHLHDARPGKCRIQNRSIALATGETIVFLDDDVVVSRDYVAAIERFFNDYPQFAAMKGRILAAEDPLTIAGPMAPYLDLPLVDHGEEVLEVRGVMGANMAFRACALRMVGPFDERLGPGAAGHEEEPELSRRLRQAGFRIGYAPHALVWHEVDRSRAVRARFIRVARERGYCRTLHEHHSQREVALKIAIAAIRLAFARALNASVVRIAREERRLAVAQGMRDGFCDRRPNNQLSGGLDHASIETSKTG
jgi:GT2 family glycosyltransferase